MYIVFGKKMLHFHNRSKPQCWHIHGRTFVPLLLLWCIWNAVTFLLWCIWNAVTSLYLYHVVHRLSQDSAKITLMNFLKSLIFIMALKKQSLQFLSILSNISWQRKGRSEGVKNVNYKGRGWSHLVLLSSQFFLNTNESLFPKLTKRFSENLI